MLIVQHALVTVCSSRNAAYLVRPDGYVALALEGPREVGELTALVRRWGLRLGTPAQ